MAIVTGTKAPKVYGDIPNMMHESKALVLRNVGCSCVDGETSTAETRADSRPGTEQPDPLSVCVMSIEQ